ncbi:hypothetical protein ACIA8K_12560 [Catenuloplanes sp. NPDC051500]|uniref:hypothetical protein n=1 Tax=Catenuloplanes sp. NPDC051500 TaxID=3363959 RepID=UPI0037B08A56
MAQLNPLARLISDHQQRTGESYAKIGRRGNLSRSVVHALANNPIKAVPKPETLAGLALGLGLPVERVTIAAQRAAGYNVYPATLATGDEIVIAHYHQLNEADRRRVADFIETLFTRTDDS